MKVAVVGGAGYVGMETCRALQRKGHQVFAVTRSNGAILLAGSGATVVPVDRVQEMPEVDVVVNLAFPSRGPTFEIPIRNRELIDLLGAVARSGARVVHTSTIAVFGFDLSEPVIAGPVRHRREYAYIESKIEFERLLARRFAGRACSVVRLGNVWGPASPTWTAALADKLQFGDAVGVDSVDGYSNVTDVANVADYLCHVAEREVQEGLRFHHLAEFSDVRWSWWINRLSRRLGVRPVLSRSAPVMPQSPYEELRASIRRHSPLSVAREWMSGRFTGSLYRSAVRALPTQSHGYLRRAAPVSNVTSDDDDLVFLTVVAASKRFVSVLRDDWTPVVDLEESWRRVETWLGDAGY